MSKKARMMHKAYRKLKAICNKNKEALNECLNSQIAYGMCGLDITTDNGNIKALDCNELHKLSEKFA